MAFSQTAICNAALANIRISRFIQSIDEDSVEAAVCKLFYELALREILEEKWSFATSYQELALVEENPNNEWLYSYRYPVDCVYIQKVTSEDRARQDSVPAPYSIGSDDSGKLIFTDEPNAWIRYTRYIDNTGLFPAKFVEALSWLLASKIASPLAKTDLAEYAFKMYTIKLGAARTFDGNESQKDQDFEAEWIRER